jgi:copper chaperone CopZ
MNMKGFLKTAGVLALAAVVLTGCASGGGTGGAVAAAGATEENAVIHKVSQAEMEAARAARPINGKRAVLWVNGLGCPLCATNIDLVLAKVKGVSNVKVDLSTGKVSLDVDPATPPTAARLATVVEDSGFTLVKIETIAN